MKARSSSSYIATRRGCAASWCASPATPRLPHDALQDALLRAWQNIDRFQARSSFFTWLTRIGINEAYRTIRRNEAAATLPLDDAVGERIASWGDQPDELFESREFLAAVDTALARLPTDYRAAVVLRDVGGLSTSEAADVLGIGERALKSRLHRGRMALRRELDVFFGQEQPGPARPRRNRGSVMP